jgi:hypothetical protein
LVVSLALAFPALAHHSFAAYDVILSDSGEPELKSHPEVK